MILTQLKNHIEMGTVLYSKKMEYGLGGNRYWLTPTTLELRINTSNLKLCIVQKPYGLINPDQHRNFYNSDVNYFKHGSGLRGTDLRFNFTNQPEGQEVMFMQASHITRMRDVIRHSSRSMVGFNSLELKLINARYKAARRELEKLYYEQVQGREVLDGFT